MSRIALATAMLIASTSLVFAQASPKTPAPAPKPTQPAATAPTQPAPSASAATPATTTAPRPAPSAVAPSAGDASTPEAARAIAQQRISGREASCRAKGSFYKWVPPHAPGDVNPRTSRYFTGYSNGKCAIDNAAVAAASKN